MEIFLVSSLGFVVCVSIISLFETLRRLTRIREQQLEQFKVLQRGLSEQFKVLQRGLSEFHTQVEKFGDKVCTYNTEHWKDVRDELVSISTLLDNHNELFNSHLKKVEAVIAAAMPYMEGNSLTPENVVKAFKEMQEDADFSLEQATKELNNMIGGQDY